MNTNSNINDFFEQAMDHKKKKVFLSDVEILESLKLQLRDESVQFYEFGELSKRFEDSPNIVDLIKSWIAHRRRIILVPGIGFLWIHIRTFNDKGGFWGLYQNLYDELINIYGKENISHKILLLIGRNDNCIADGYLFDKITDPLFKSEPPIHGGSYKIVENNIFQQYKIKTLDRICDEIKLLLSKKITIQ